MAPPKAEKNLKKLPKELIIRVLNKFDELIKNPFRFLEHYEGQDVYKFRIGDYRALIDIDFKNKILFVRVFDKRGRIYER
ncbi:MAG: type II toxin-antitoxin system RelE/ParE family toxin [Nanoarchaeota archaeon]